jgi:hypothetical protein
MLHEERHQIKDDSSNSVRAVTNARDSIDHTHRLLIKVQTCTPICTTTMQSESLFRQGDLVPAHTHTRTHTHTQTHTQKHAHQCCLIRRHTMSIDMKTWISDLET